MKNIIIVSSILFTLSGCKKLTDVLNTTPPNDLVPENVVATAEGARNLLNGAYAVLHDQYYYMFTEHVPSVLAGTMIRNGFLINQQFQDNAVLPNLADINNMWIAFYKMVNQTNWVIKLVNELPPGELSDTEKEEMIAQARGLRAMAHFDALRYFGQFYDMNSPLGVVVRTDPANYTTRHIKRSTVAEVYTVILDDLDYAIDHGPAFSKTYTFSVTAAKALKARVLLFQGKYAEAADLAHEVIEDNTRHLSPSFSAVFSTGFNSTEVIFMRYTDAGTLTADRKKYTYTQRYAIASPWLKTLMADDPRAATSYTASDGTLLKVNNTAFSSPTYFIRLAEMYLIEAEGLARSNAPLEDAKEPLEEITSRAYGRDTLSPATTKEELLDEIFTEIIKELCFENGSDWFATIRFDKIMGLKPKVTSVNQYILPVPEAELLSNNLFGDQNPGYDQ